MANRLQFRRGAGIPGTVFYEGEPIFDKTNKVLYVGNDGGNGGGAGSAVASATAYSTVVELLTAASSSAGGSVKFYEDTDNGNHYVQLSAPSSVAVSKTFVLPAVDGSAGDLLKTDGNGNLTFSAPAPSSFNIAADSGTTDSFNTGQTLTFTGGDGIDTVVSDNAVTFSAQRKANGGLVIESGALAVDLGASSITGTLAIADGGTGATSAEDARTALGLVIGTHVQAYDAELAALASVTSAADKVPYFTGSGTAGVTTLSSFGRSLIDDVDAAAARATLGISNVTLAGSYDYITIEGQTITRNQIDLTTDVTGALPNANLANSTITVTDGTPGTGTATALGGTITFVGTANEVTVSQSSGTVTIGLPDNVTIAQDLTVTGNLRVVGTAVTFETRTVKVEDRIIELGLVNGSAPSSATTWDSGILFNYQRPQDEGQSKKSGVIWLDNQFMALVSSISESAGTVNESDPQVTVSSYAPVAAGGLYIGGIASANEVINSSQQAVNLVFDGGSY